MPIISRDMAMMNDQCNKVNCFILLVQLLLCSFYAEMNQFHCQGVSYYLLSIGIIKYKSIYGELQ